MLYVNSRMRKKLLKVIVFVSYFIDIVCSQYSHNVTARLGPMLTAANTRRAGVEEAHMTTPQLAQHNDYPAETYTVTTEDGYVLEMHRIPWGVKSPHCRNKVRPVVFCMHDIISSSSDFLINGPENSLGYLLADAGYDVWFGNARGNRYCRNHINLAPVNIAFWDFSWHEIGYYDVPAMIDFVLNMTEQRQLTYVGFSQGSTVYYVMCSEKPEYNNKIKMAYHLSPVAYLSFMISPILRFFSIFSNSIGLLFDVLGVGEFLPKSDLMTQFGHIVCKGGDITQFFCSTPLFLLSGFNMNNLNYTRLPVYMGHTPAGGSTRQFMHYGQIVQSGAFRRFDAGVADNMLKYQSLRPPFYKLEKCTAPIVLIHAASDWFNMPPDVDRLARELPNVVKKVQVRDPTFAHIDFLFGINAKEMVHDDLIAMMKSYE